jgi:hypothetical protein
MSIGTQRQHPPLTVVGWGGRVRVRHVKTGRIGGACHAAHVVSLATRLGTERTWYAPSVSVT